MTREDAQDRVLRIHTLAAYIVEHPGCSVAKVAQVFNRSEAQLRKDIAVLQEAGLGQHYGGETVLFDYSYYSEDKLSLLEDVNLGQRLDLSRQEARSVAAGLSVLAQTLDPETATVAQRAAAKIAATCGAEVTPALRVVAQDKRSRLLATKLRKSIESGQRLHLRYVDSADHISERKIDPLVLLTDTEVWTLQAYCHIAQGIRNFRLDRILQIDETGDFFSPQDHDVDVEQSLVVSKQEASGTKPAAATLPIVRLHLASQARWVSERIPVLEVSEQEDGSTVVSLEVFDADWFQGLLLQLGPAVLEITPTDLVLPAVQAARAALTNYEALP